MTRKGDVGRESLRGVATSISAQPPPRAQRMLEAAQRVLDRDGADKLTLRSVAREAGETTSLVLYYFTTMEKLEAVLLDSLWHKLDVEFLASISSLPDDTAIRVDALVDFHASIASDPTRYQRYFELVSGVVQKHTTRSEIASIYRAYRAELNVPLLRHPGLTVQDTEALAALVLAAAEGLPYWHLVSRGAVDLDAGFAFLRYLLKRRLGLSINPPGDLAVPQTAGVIGPSVTAVKSKHATATRLLNAGHDILESSGLRGLSFETIGRESGESRPAVGYHFGNKAAFVDALAVDVAQRWGGKLANPDLWRSFLAGAATPELAKAAQSATVKMLQVFPVTQRSVEAYEAAVSSLLSIRTVIDEQVKRVVDGKAATAYAGLMADLCLSSVTGLVLQRMYDPDDFDMHPPLDQLVALLS